MLQISFEDNRCRNIFLSVLNKNTTTIKVFHKSYGSYTSLYIESSAEWENKEDLIKEEYEQIRQQFLTKVQQLAVRTVQHFSTKEYPDLSGEQLLKLSIPSPYSFPVVKTLLNNAGIKVEGDVHASLVTVSVKDYDEFEKFWTGEWRSLVRHHEDKIQNLSEAFYARL